MKIVQINENQIQCTLSAQDLAERNLRLNELSYGSVKARHLFQDVVRQACDRLGFDAQDAPLSIDAVPLRDGSIVLDITKVDYPEELDPRFSNFTASGNPLADLASTLPAEGADSILDLFGKMGKTAANPVNSGGGADTFVPLKDTAAAVSDSPDEAKAEEKQTPDTSADIVRIFSFRNLDHVVRLARVLERFYHGDNSLYYNRDGHIYYLQLHKGGHTPEEFNKVCNIMSEYSLPDRLPQTAGSYFGEHLQCVVPHDALQRIAEAGASIDGSDDEMIGQ